MLYKTAMPGVLIETGFISNPNDEKFLLSDKGQDQMVEAIFNAFKEYKYQVENRIPLRTLPSDTATAVNTEVVKGNEYVPSIKESTIKTSGEVVNNGSPADVKPLAKTENNQVSYRVQFAMYPDWKPLDSKLFYGIDDVKMYRHAGAYKYTSGDFATMDEALLYRKKLIAKGYKDAFVVIFRDNERISNEEAKRLNEKK